MSNWSYSSIAEQATEAWTLLNMQTSLAQADPHPKPGGHFWWDIRLNGTNQGSGLLQKYSCFKDPKLPLETEDSKTNMHSWCETCPMTFNVLDPKMHE